ncbi:MAG TPA: ATP-binding protein [Bryobacteraceae bacterium]|nr:ATP-binding protein [Bryobacteraceae bacterium]
MSIVRLRSVALVVIGTIGLSYLGFVAGITPIVAAMLLLLAVLLTGTYQTLAEAVAVSLTAALCLDFFFVPPIKAITISDVQGWFSLLVFLAVSLLSTNLSARARRQKLELVDQQKETEKLYAFGRAMLLFSGEDVRRLIVNKCIELFDFSEVALLESFTGIIQRSHIPGSFPDDLLQRVAVCGLQTCREEGAITVLPISLGNKTFGSLGFVAKMPAETTLQGIVNTVAVALAQAQAVEASTRAEAVRQGEELKSVMIDALAHDLKTPLTVIEAATDMLLPLTEKTSPQQTDLVQVVKSESKGLRRLIDEAIHLAKIDAKKLKLEAERMSVEELIQAALHSTGDRIGSRPVSVEIPSDLPFVFVDRELSIQALKQLLDNAVKYSPARSAVAIAAEEVSGSIAITIRDSGQGLTEVEQSRVFEKFYRGRQDTSGIQGTGMGLAIAKEIVEAHGGAITVESQLGQGSQFTVFFQAVANPAAVQG